MKTYYKFLFKSFLITLLLLGCSSDENSLNDDLLKVNFDGDAKIEVGGPFVGVEMHHSSPLLQRISFFYPVANSMDLSTDFWKRDTSFIMALGLKIGDGEKEKLGRKNYLIDLTPYSVIFHESDQSRGIDISYRFLKNKPAMVITYELTNLQDEEKEFEFYTHLETALRTCHTYNFIDKAWTEYEESTSGIFANFDNPETQSAQIFVINAGEKPTSYNSVSYIEGLSNPSTEWWESSVPELTNSLIPQYEGGRPAAKFLYKKSLKTNEKMTIVQIVGSCRQNEGKELSAYLINNYEKEISLYEQSILNKVYNNTKLISDDSTIDRSTYWAKAILEANAHYLDGEVVPIPCPAEYNFYFTHDVLKTNLAAVNFDIERVKRDLDYIIRHATEDRIIPHAYYWKDSTYRTEYADHDNWNNFWFTIVSGTYFRHSADIEFLNVLYPYIAKSIHQALMTKGDDDLMWSYRPDWWDIGKLYGTKSYMTILAIKALKEYIFISSALNLNMDKLSEYDSLAIKMQGQLVDLLWDDNQKYLINYYEPGKLDDHYYIGSLLSAHYGLLEKQKISELVTTAKEKLLDERVGIYNVFPMDFHLIKDYLKFVGNEAGDEFYYANGGIWPHGNAWYALALMADGQKDNAFNFIKNVMTLDGIISGPNGQPAMYEVRNGNYNDPSIYGTVDKPQFLWAAGWYLYCLYHLYGIEESSWNISFDPYLSQGQTQTSFDLFAGGNLLNVDVNGEGDYIKSIKYNGNEYPSAVIPTDIKRDSHVNIELGSPEKPYLYQTNSILLSGNLEGKTLTLNFQAFSKHSNISKIISPTKPTLVKINGSDEIVNFSVDGKDKHFETLITFFQQTEEDRIVVEFE